GLFDIGIDSLTGIELVGHLQTSLGCSLPSTLIFKYPTIANLVDFLSNEVLLPDQDKPDGKDSSPAPLKIPAAGGQLDELSKDELAHRLAKKLAGHFEITEDT